MDLGNDYTHVVIATTGSTGVIKARTSGAKTYLHACLLTVDTTAPTYQLTLKSLTTSATSSTAATIVGGPFRMEYGHPVQLAFVPQVQGCMHGVTGGNLAVSTTGGTIHGYAIVSHSTV